MNFNTLSYLIVTIAALFFCGTLLYVTPDQGTHDFAIGLVSLVLGHWFGYSNQLTGSAPGPAPVIAPEAPKQA